MNLYLAHILVKKIRLDYMIQMHIQAFRSLMENTYHNQIQSYQLDQIFKEDIKTKCMTDIELFLCQNFTDDELKQLVAFYSSPVGQKFMSLSIQTDIEQLIKSTLKETENKIIEFTSKKHAKNPNSE